MKSIAVTAGQTGRIGQYNDLREDARASSYLLPHQKSTPDLQLYVEPGNAYLNELFMAFAGGNSPSFPAPTVNPRIDILALLKPYTNEPGIIEHVYNNQSIQANGDTVHGQTFTADRDGMTLKSVTLNMQRGPDIGSSAGVIVRIYATDGSGLPTGSPLSELSTNTGVINTSFSEVTFDLPDLALTNGVKYALTVHYDFTTSGTNYWVKWKYNDSNSYAGGDLLTSFTTKDVAADAYFKINYTFTTTAPTLVRIEGQENASPVAPLMPEIYIPICHVYNRVGQTTIRDVDTAGQGYIQKDTRPFIQGITTQNLKKRFVAGEAITKGDAVIVAAAGAEETAGADTSSVNSYHYIEGSDGDGQIFTTSSTHKSLTAIAIKYQSIPRSTSANIKLYAVSGGVGSGSAIAQADLGSISSSGGSGWLTFTFSSPVVLTPNTQYAFFLQVTDPDDGINWYFNTVNPYPGGYRLAGAFPGTADTSRETSFKVYEILTTSGQIYKADTDAALAERYNHFVGIADETIAQGSEGQVIIGGISPNHSGMTVGATQYLQNTPGLIGPSAGTNSRKIGRAISGTELLIIHDNV